MSEVAPHIERQERKQAAMDALAGHALPITDEEPAPTEAAPVEPTEAPQPPENASSGTPSPEVSAQQPQYVPASEFQRLAAAHRQLRQELLERSRPVAQTTDDAAARAKKAIEERDYATLQQMGLDLNEWADATLKDTEDPTAAAVRQLKRELGQVTKQLSTTQQELQKRQQREAAARLETQKQEIFQDIRETLDSDPSLKLLSLAGREADVYNVMGQYAAETQRTYGKAEYLPPAQAAKVVLQREEQRLQQLFDHARTLPQYASRFAAPEPAQPAPSASSSSAPAPGVSISNQGGGSEPPRELSREERKAQILRQLVNSQQG